MTRQVFISHSATDRDAAEAIRAALEAAGMSCWIAPRDIPPGAPWAAAIMAGIAAADVMLLVHSAASAASEMVFREVNAATDGRKRIIPVLIDATPVEDVMQFYLGATHWFDASLGALASHLAKIAGAVSEQLVPAGAVVPSERQVLALPDKPSLVVLPFQNMSSDPDQAFFADGLVEDITTALARIRWLFVIDRASAFTYRDRTADVRRIGRELGVRYVLQGSLRRSGERLRVSAQLVEAASGAHLWTERFDRKVDDIFDVQDEINQAVVLAIEPTIAGSERQRAGRAPRAGLGTLELYQRGLWHFYRFTNEDSLQAIGAFDAARACDPDNASVHAALCLACCNRGWQFVPRDDETWIRRAQEHGRIAAALDPFDPLARASYANSLNLLGDHAAALRESEAAVAAGPNAAMAHGMHGAVLAYSGQPEAAVPFLNQALRLNPMDPYRFTWVHCSCTAHYFAGDYAACLDAGRELCRMQPDLVHGYRAMLVALAELGREAEARSVAEILRRRFAPQMRAFLSVRYPEFRLGDYTAYVASLAKGGVVAHTLD